MELNIIEYKINNTTIQSNFIFNFTCKVKNVSENYILETPLNPLLDIELLQLSELNFKEKMKKINNLINNKEYSYKTIYALSNFILWLNSFFYKEENVL